MEERYHSIKKKFHQILKEKNRKEKINKSFIESNKNDNPQEDKNEYTESYNFTKNSFYRNEEANKNMILEQKFNVLKDSLDKLQIVLEKNIQNNNNSTNEVIQKINDIKNFYMNELENDSLIINNDLTTIKNEVNDVINNKLNQNSEVNNIINTLEIEKNNQIEESMNKINFYSNNQQNYLANINKDINLRINEINELYDNNINYSNQKKDIILNNICTFNNKLNKMYNEEKKHRENFKNGINSILNCEIDNLRSIDLYNSLELIKNGEKPF